MSQPENKSPAPPPLHPDPFAPPQADDDAAVHAAPAAPRAIARIVESLLFAADRPLSIERLEELLPESSRAEILDGLSALEAECLAQHRGIQVHQVAGGYQLRTAPESAPYVQKLLQQRPVRLTRAQLETLSIVAYRQPITRPEIDDIRGVDSGGTLKVLLERNLLRILGKREEPGRPILYGTTKDFLEFFNLRDLKDLPTLREYYELSEEHQTQVNAMSAALEDLSERGRPGTARAPDLSRPGVTWEASAAGPAGAPPPLQRVELRDLDIEEDDEQLREIDSLIEGVKVSVPIAIEVPDLRGRRGEPAPASQEVGTPEGPSTRAGSEGGALPLDEDEEREPEEL